MFSDKKSWTTTSSNQYPETETYNLQGKNRGMPEYWLVLHLLQPQTWLK
jgi:hypothetical protein